MLLMDLGIRHQIVSEQTDGFVVLSVQEVEMPLPTLLGVSVDVCVTPLPPPAGPRDPSPEKTSPLLGFWCKGSDNGTAITGISVLIVELVLRSLPVRSQYRTGFLPHVRINADYTT